MHITTLSLRNFRNFRTSKFSFCKGINTLIGENGAGKTNVFHAIRLLLDDTMPRNSRLFASDFNRSLGDAWQGHWIIISIEFDELDANEECQTLNVHAIGDAEGNKGRYTFYFRPKQVIRKQLYEYSQTPRKTTEGLKAILSDITINDYEAVFRCRNTVDFTNEEIYRQYVGNFETITFPQNEPEDTSVYGVAMGAVSLSNQVSCTFVKALRDVEAELKSYSSSPLINLLRDKDKKVKVEDKEEIITSIKDLNMKVGALKEVTNISDGITESIQKAVGHTYAPNLDIRAELPEDMERLFQSLKLWVGDPDEDNYRGRLWELSLGGANLIYLSMKLLEYERVRVSDRPANFLLVEEPEAHVHTHIQKSLFKNISTNHTQVIVSTHSTQISSASKISSMNILSRGLSQAEVFQPAANLSPKDVDGIERYLDAVRSNLLFAKGIIMVEGDAEEILVPEMILKVFGISLDELGISLVNIGSTGFENLAVLFHPNRVRRNCAIITDLDAVSVSKDSVTTEEWTKCLNSEKSGTERKDRLEVFIQGNPYVKIFFANHTFEVDFLRAGNQNIITAWLPTFYTRQAERNASLEKINSANSSLSNWEVLRLAKAAGKGWFAIQLARHLTHEIKIPDYILKAIIFAAPKISIRTLATMARYRLKEMKNNNMPEVIQSVDRIELAFPETQENSSNEQLMHFLSLYQATFIEDALTNFSRLATPLETPQRPTLIRQK
jgi:predicted ATP-dependent endonuclease of OLD family